MSHPKVKTAAPAVPSEVSEAIASVITVEDGAEIATATNKPGSVRTVSTDTFGNKIEEH